MALLSGSLGRDAVDTRLTAASQDWQTNHPGLLPDAFLLSQSALVESKVTRLAEMWEPRIIARIHEQLVKSGRVVAPSFIPTLMWTPIRHSSVCPKGCSRDHQIWVLAPGSVPVRLNHFHGVRHSTADTKESSSRQTGTRQIQDGHPVIQTDQRGPAAFMASTKRPVLILLIGSKG